MPESEDQRSDRARTLAYAQGKREAEVDGRLDSAEARLKAINGSIERHATNARELRDMIELQNNKIDQINATLATNAALEAEKSLQLRVANDRSLSSRTYILGVAGVIIAMLSVCATVLEAVH